MTTLALASMPGAKAAEISGTDSFDWTFVYTVIVMLGFSFFGICKFLHQVFVFVKIQFTVAAEEEAHSSTQGPVVTLGSSHGVVGDGHDFEETEEAKNDEYQSSESSTESCVGRGEWDRWQRLKEEVEGEEKQKKWRKIKEMLENPRDARLDHPMRAFIVSEDRAENRCRRFKELLSVKSTSDFSDHQVQQWIRFMNDYMVTSSELNYEVKKLKLANETNQGRKTQAQRYLDGELKDRQSQTPTHYDRDQVPAQYVQLPWNRHGAWLHSDEFYPHRD
ncbi:unnamed protein product [Durusdinium trenchii]|uniref:Uncharacterized protein n=1 Tax=Durusdinium trenchii TaxID=1381693 RepID=A0ABP0HW82_9DINO